jgi:hypothetical protein
MTQPAETQPLSKDQVLDEIGFLITVEHALIVEYLSVSCALGYDLAGTDGGPADGPGRAAAAAAKSQADFGMLRVAALVRALSALRPAGGFDRAIEIADASGTKISLEPLAGRLEDLADREKAIAAAVDARYARLIPAMAVTASGADTFSDDLREAVRNGTNHASAASAVLDPLAGQPVADLLLATRRSGSTEAEKALSQASDRTYSLLAGTLANFYGGFGGDDPGVFRSAALNAMDILNLLNAAMVHAKLLPSFPRPRP